MGKRTCDLAMCLYLLSGAPIAQSAQTSRSSWSIVWWRGEPNAFHQVDCSNGSRIGDFLIASAEAGSGFTLDGQADAISLGNVACLHLQDFTITAWVRRFSVSVTTGDYRREGLIFSYGHAGYGLGIDNSGRPLLTQVDLFTVKGLPLITDTDWHHLAVTKSGTSILFFVDGEGRAGPEFTPEFGFSTLPAIGARGDNFGNRFWGTIEAVAIYNHSLHPALVRALYASGCPCKRNGSVPSPRNAPQSTSKTVFAEKATSSVASPSTTKLSAAVKVSWWRGEGNALDGAGANHGVLAGNATYATAKVGLGFVLDGRGDAVTVGKATNLRLQDFTIEAWVKRSSTSLATYDYRQEGLVFSYGHAGYGLGVDNNGRPLLTQVDLFTVKGNPVVTDTEFHHVAVTKSGASVCFYVDGRLNGTASFPFTFDFSTSPAIGARADQMGNSFFGIIDEVSVYNRALSADEIMRSYGPGTPTRPQLGSNQTQIKREYVAGEAAVGTAVTMRAPIQISGGFIISFEGAPGQIYSLQRAEAPGGPWVKVGEVTTDSIGIGSYMDTNSPPATACYRTSLP